MLDRLRFAAGIVELSEPAPDRLPCGFIRCRIDVRGEHEHRGAVFGPKRGHVMNVSLVMLLILAERRHGKPLGMVVDVLMALGAEDHQILDTVNVCGARLTPSTRTVLLK